MSIPNSPSTRRRRVIVSGVASAAAWVSRSLRQRQLGCVSDSASLSTRGSSDLRETGLITRRLRRVVGEMRLR